MSILCFEKRILFLGYGAVAKAVWNYMGQFIKVDPKCVYLVDKSEKAFYGPGLLHVHCLVRDVDATNFEEFVSFLEEGDVVIDLTFSSATYFFIQTCWMRGLHYLNTSIEDHTDDFSGKSIHVQQQYVHRIFADCAAVTPIRSCVVTECGQNPGLIQHYVLFALQQLYEEMHPESPLRYDRDALIQLISELEIGTILMSERDQLKTTRPLDKNRLYNTWSVGGFICEALDCCELVKGTENTFIQPRFENIHQGLEQLMEPHQVDGTNVFFLQQNGMTSLLTSIAPVWKDGNIVDEVFQGQLIHHGEIFELASYFGPNAPFMSYVYQSSPYMNDSFHTVSSIFGRKHLSLFLKQENSFQVFDNILVSKEEAMKGFDSIGCTIFCGTDSVKRIVWCGSIVKDDECMPEFTPTIVQVAAGVLSGLSFILEKGRVPGYYPPLSMDTDYMIKKAKPLLGTFFIKEIEPSLFPGFVHSSR